MRLATHQREGELVTKARSPREPEFSTVFSPQTTIDQFHNPLLDA